METNSTFRRGVAAAAGVGLIATPLWAFSSPAFASSADCAAVEAGATEVLPGVCEMQYVETGEFTFTAPSGVAKLTALIVGGGGATLYDDGAYTGGGGAVIYVADVDSSTTVAITVGMGAQDATTAQGGNSSVNSNVANGGKSGYKVSPPTGSGGQSGNGNMGSSYSFGNMGAGGGAGGSASDNFGGIGLTASEVANDAALWPAVDGEPYYGGGGDVAPLIAGFGEAGTGADGSGDRNYGMDGLVILRWTMNSELPATGVDSGTYAAFAAAFMIPGAALLAFATRGRRSRAQG